MTDVIEPLVLPDQARRLRILFLAKHALGDGRLHPKDGNHAIYHHEVRTILESLGLDLRAANRFEALFDPPDVDFVFSLLNRAGFVNSEMTAPLLCNYHRVPFLGASPILRGVSDDKHLSKLEAAARGVPTLPWAIYRRGAPVRLEICPRADRLVIKPNASSASWGVSDAVDWTGVREAVAGLHAEGHDAIVEPFMRGSDVEAPVIETGKPKIMPVMEFRQSNPDHLRTYWEKRDIVARRHKYDLVAFDDAVWLPRVLEHTRRMAEAFSPFDYGRFEFRLDRERGELVFLEVNLNCNLWSEKVFGRSAKIAGLTQSQLIETILCAAFARHALIGPPANADASRSAAEA